MKTLATAVLAGCAALAVSASAQAQLDVEDILYRAADTLGMLRTPAEIDRIATMTFSATGSALIDGEPCTLTHYRVGVRYPIPNADHAFPVPGARIDVGCDRGQSAPMRRVEVVAGRYAWDETEPGIGAMPAAQSNRERLFRVWTLPQGIVKAAMLAGDAVAARASADARC